MAVPLTDLTKKGQLNKIEWGEPQERAYTSLKHAVTSRPVLHLPDHDQPYIHVAYVLMHQRWVSEPSYSRFTTANCSQSDMKARSSPEPSENTRLLKENVWLLFGQ